MILGAVAAAITALSVGLLATGAHAATDRAFDTPLARFAAAGVLTVAILVGLAEGLLVLGALGRWSLVLPAAIGLGLRVRFGAPAPLPWRAIGVDLPVLAFAAWAAVVAARALTLPPTSWDDLTYHLPKVARFVTTGGWAPLGAPGAWGYYDLFARGGEALWTWGALASGDDTLVMVGPLLVALVLPFAAAFAAESFGIAPARELGLAVAACPAALGYGNAGYVDNLTLLGFCWGVGFAARAGIAAGGLAGLAFGIGIAAKPTLAPLFVVSLPFLAWRSPRAAGAALAASAVGAPHYLDAWARTGAPLWPFAAAGMPGHPENVALMAGHLQGGVVVDPLVTVVAVFGLAPPFADRTVNVGWIGLPVIAMAAVGAIRGGRRSPGSTLWIATIALVMLANLASGAVRAQLTLFVINLTRLILPLWAAIVWLAAGATPSRAVWGAIVLAEVFIGFPRVILPAEGLAEAAVGAAAAATLALAVARPAWGLAAVAALGALVGAVRPTVRAAAWTPDATLWQKFAASGVAVMGGAPAWAVVDDGAPHTIALAQGWDGLGISTFVYPWLGSRWQNRVVAVAPTVSGALVDAREIGGADLDPDAWACRLVAAGVDRVVTIPPASVEEGWALARPEGFPLLAEVAGTRVFGVGEVCRR